jgi:nicotinamidase-related amidase
MSDASLTIDPEHTALLVMDYQVGILASLADADVLLFRAADAIATVRRHGGHIGYVRVAFEDVDVEAIPSTNKGFSQLAATGIDLHNESPATAIHQGVSPEAGDIIVRKTRVGAFSTTDLDEQLRRIGVTNLILAGVSTSGVVLSTVRDAADRDYRLFVLADATADRVPEVHEILMESIFPRQAEVIASADLEGLLSQVAPG